MLPKFEENSSFVEKVSLLADQLQPLSREALPLSFSMIVGGDLMFDRHIRTKAEMLGNYQEIFSSELTSYLKTADYVLANLEGPVTENKSISQNSLVGGPGNYTFTFSPEILSTLKDHNFNLLNLGNNHILNFGQTGLISTLNYLATEDIIYFGHTGSDLLSESYRLLKISGQKIALFNYNQFTANAKNKAFADLEEVKAQDVNLIILYTHWGNEYAPTANGVITNLAHEFIDAGVDLIVGSHPHVVQNSEIYRGKSIYYSLGNFVFDQYFSNETKNGLLLKIDFNFNQEEQRWIYEVNEQRIKMTSDGKTSLNLLKSEDGY